MCFSNSTGNICNSVRLQTLSIYFNLSVPVPSILPVRHKFVFSSRVPGIRVVLSELVMHRYMLFFLPFIFVTTLRLFMRPSSLGGAAYCVALCLSVCPSVPLSLPSVTSFRQPLASRMYRPASVTSRHLANYNDTDVLFGTHGGPHIVRPSRPHKFLFCYE